MSGFKEYERYDGLGLGLAELVRRREAAPRELLEAALARIERIDPKIRAVCGLAGEAAQRAIAQGLPKGPFTGVPFLLKDITAAAQGLPMSCGSRFFQGVGGDHDTELVARYRRAGLVIFGRTTTPEMAISPSSEALVYGGSRSRGSMIGSSSWSGARVGLRRNDVKIPTGFAHPFAPPAEPGDLGQNPTAQDLAAPAREATRGGVR